MILISLILAEIRSNEYIAVALGSSGIPTSLMEGGRKVRPALKH